jgi:hypothetical protein
MLWVTDAAYVENYKIRLKFNNGETGIADLQDIIKNDHRAIFQELQNLTLFQDFHLDMDTVV